MGRLVAALAGLCSGPLILFFGGSYAFAGATVAFIVYSLGFIASFYVTEPYGFEEFDGALEGNIELEPVPVSGSASVKRSLS